MVRLLLAGCAVGVLIGAALCDLQQATWIALAMVAAAGLLELRR